MATTQPHTCSVFATSLAMHRGRSFQLRTNTSFVELHGPWHASNAVNNLHSRTFSMHTTTFSLAKLLAVALFLTACHTERTVTQDMAKSFEGVTIDRSSGEVVSSVTSFRAKWTPVGKCLVLVPDTTAPAYITQSKTQYNNTDSSYTYNSVNSKNVVQVNHKSGVTHQAVRPHNWLSTIGFSIVATFLIIFWLRRVKKRI